MSTSSDNQESLQIETVFYQGKASMNLRLIKSKAGSYFDICSDTQVLCCEWYQRLSSNPQLGPKARSK